MKKWLGTLTIEETGGGWFLVLSGRLIIAEFVDREDAEFFIEYRERYGKEISIGPGVSVDPNEPLEGINDQRIQDPVVSPLTTPSLTFDDFDKWPTALLYSDLEQMIGDDVKPDIILEKLPWTS